MSLNTKISMNDWVEAQIEYGCLYCLHLICPMTQDIKSGGLSNVKNFDCESKNLRIKYGVWEGLSNVKDNLIFGGDSKELMCRENEKLFYWCSNFLLLSGWNVLFFNFMKELTCGCTTPTQYF